MKYTATVDFSTTLTDDDILERLTQYHGAIGASLDGYRAIYTFDSESLDSALDRGKEIARELGLPFAFAVAPSDMVDNDVAHGELPPLVSVTEAAEMLDITPQGVNKKLKTGSLPGVKVGNTWVIPLHAVASVM